MSGNKMVFDLENLDAFRAEAAQICRKIDYMMTMQAHFNDLYRGIRNEFETLCDDFGISYVEGHYRVVKK